MAKCSTKGCNKGATARVSVSTAAGSKSRPVCNACASVAPGDVTLNDRIKLSKNGPFLEKLKEFAEERKLSFDLLQKCLVEKELGELSTEALNNVHNYTDKFTYNNAGVRFRIYIGGPFQHATFKDEQHCYAKYRINESTINQLGSKE